MWVHALGGVKRGVYREEGRAPSDDRHEVCPLISD